ncbi:MAG: hypothetical protein QXG40_04255 [Ignisphaera sp.]
MEESPPPRKTRVRQPDTEIPQSTIATVAPPTTPMPVEVPKEITDELSRLIQDLLLKAHELSFEYSTMECDDILNCPLAKKAKELFRIIKQLSEISKKTAMPQRTQYVS